METKIKKRKALYCNAKVLLMFLVIYGHLIETHVDDSAFFLWQYRIIYTVHMPMFAFLSGFFLKSEYDCLKQMRGALKIYVPAQLTAMLVLWITEKRVLSFFVPYWHLWYLLSLFFWAGICYFATRVRKTRSKALLLLLSGIVACLCGCVDGIGRFLSLSRTLCFLPFVLLGCFLPKDIDFGRYKAKGAILGVVAICTFLICIPKLPVELLYFADSYEKLGITFGVGWRCLCILIAFGIGNALLCFMPRQSIAVSKVGVDTLLIYLLHGPVVKLIRNVDLGNAWFAIIAPVLAVFIYLGLYLVFGRRKNEVQIIS